MAPLTLTLLKTLALLALTSSATAARQQIYPRHAYDGHPWYPSGTGGTGVVPGPTGTGTGIPLPISTPSIVPPVSLPTGPSPSLPINPGPGTECPPASTVTVSYVSTVTATVIVGEGPSTAGPPTPPYTVPGITPTPVGGPTATGTGTGTAPSGAPSGGYYAVYNRGGKEARFERGVPEKRGVAQPWFA